MLDERKKAAPHGYPITERVGLKTSSKCPVNFPVVNNSGSDRRALDESS